MDLEQRVRWAEREDKDADPLEFYTEHYQGTSRGRLSRVDGGLYKYLKERKLLENIPLRKLRYGDDPLAYYKENYPGVTRGVLERIDHGLYYGLTKKKLLQFVPLAEQGRPSKYGDDPLAYYREHYPGFTRWELAQADGGLYQRLRRKKLLKHVPLNSQKNK